ncbi:MAG: tetratricopeptide repeat protein [Candidatus Magasanikbacteria bacterium]|nr:tetratricopeptide repeat protein [Candidatus Magasanikbacteria bacterium]
MIIYGLAVALIIVALLVGGTIIVRKFPQLTHLDVAQLPEERENRRKREILTRRLEAQAARFGERFRGVGEPLARWWGALQLRFRQYVGKVERLWHHEERLRRRARPASSTTDEDKVAALIARAESALAAARYEEAEGLFIAAIKINNRAAAAYRGLADSYAARQMLEEARETYRFVLRLEPDDDSVLTRLAEIAESQGDLEEAVSYYEQAVVLNDNLAPRFYHLAELLLKLNQPAAAREAIRSAVTLEDKNPRYLDMRLETAILCGDQADAEAMYRELRLVNPENQKLAEFRERISRM